jgi:uncharacterized delta-60 repeat protein
MLDRLLVALLHLACAACLSALPLPTLAQDTGPIYRVPGVNAWHSGVAQADGQVIAAGFARFGNRQITLARYTTSGPLDPSFGNAGVATANIPGTDAEAWRAVLQPDGKILVAGLARSDHERIAVARFNPDGSLDSAFAGGGAFQFSASAVGDSGAFALALAPDGRFYVGGYTNGGSGDAMVVLRFNADGSLDATYGSNGFATAGLGGGRLHSLLLLPDGRLMYGGETSDSSARIGVLLPNGAFDATFAIGGARDIANFWGAWDMALQPDGKIVIAGGTTSSTGTIVAAARVLPSGDMDAGFGSGGIAKVFIRGDPQNGRSQGHGILVEANGTIVVGGTWAENGTTGGSGAAGAVYSDGSDPGGAWFFGVSGSVTAMSRVYGLVRMANDGFALVGSSGWDAAISENEAGGVYRSGFHFVRGEGGLPETTDLGQANVEVRASGLLSDGTLILAGEMISDERWGFAIRVRPDGTVDPSGGVGFFGPAGTELNTLLVLPNDAVLVAGSKPGSNGKAALWIGGFGGSTPLPPSTGSFTLLTDNGGAITSLARQADGAIVAGGWTTNPTWKDATFIRMTTSGTLDTSFGDQGWTVISMSTGEDLVNDVKIQPDGRIVGAGWYEVTGTQDSFAVIRLTTAGQPDSTFGSGGFRTYDFGSQTSHAEALVIQPDGQYVIGGTVFNGTTDDFGLIRVSPFGGLDPSFGSGGLVQSDFGNHNRLHSLVLVDGNRILAGGENGGAFGAARYNTDGSLDTSFADNGVLRISPGGHYLDQAIAALIDPTDGSLWLAGDSEQRPAAIHLTNMAGSFTASSTSLAVSPNPTGVRDPVTAIASVTSSSGTPTGTVSFYTDGLVLCSNKPLSGGSARCDFTSGDAGVATISAVYSGDTTYATSSASVQLRVQGFPNIFVTSSRNPSTAGESVTFTATLSGSVGTPTGTVDFLDNNVAIDGCAGMTLASGVARCTLSTLAVGTHPMSVSYSGDVAYTPATTRGPTQTVNAPTSTSNGQASLTPSSVGFGVVSMNTTSDAKDVTLANTGTAALAISSIAATAPFAQTNNCPASLAAGASCAIHVTFTPSAADGPVNSQVTVTGTLSVASDAANGTVSASLSGTAEKSLVSHFYESILGREPEPSGHDFWAAQVQAAIDRGSNVNEAWYAMAASFFVSPEYLNQQRTDDGFLDDLYRTFFNREPDAGGRAYWKDQIASGLPRVAVLVNFMFSPEFRNFTQAIFGNTQARAEVDMAGDFYRGLLARLPDDGGFSFWVGRFRNAQCEGASAVASEADAISSAFTSSAEYANRARSDADFVSDLYDAFLRRGADKGGLDFWLAELQSGRRTRDDVRHQFTLSQEFSNRVTAVASQGCIH